MGELNYLTQNLIKLYLSSSFTSSLKLLFSSGHGLRAPLSSYLGVALYKFDGWMGGWVDGWMGGWMDGYLCRPTLLMHDFDNTI